MNRASTGDGEPETSVISPLVVIGSTLTNRASVELLRINADSPAYWRVTTLPEYDGRTFRVPAQPLERIEGEFGASDGDRAIRQQVQIVALDGRLVPAAAEPFQAEGTSSAGDRIGLRLITKRSDWIDRLRSTATGSTEFASPRSPMLSARSTRRGSTTCAQQWPTLSAAD
jgi:hypothetical protein